MADHDIPPYKDFMWPTLVAMGELGGSGSIPELVEAVITAGHFTEAQQSVPHGDGPSSELEYRLAWARSYLKGMGLAENSRRAVWSLTDDGQHFLAEAVAVDDAERDKRLMALHSDYTSAIRKAQRGRPTKVSTGGTADDAEPDTDGTPSWKEELLTTLTAMAPDAFERLAQRLLREAGFTSVQVTGRSGDGGIDGVGVYRLSLVSFPVFFQCKRYTGSVSSAAVRDFRGAMSGRGDKGLLITTGGFTSDAKKESTRDGAAPIDLIDGDRLCDLLKEYEVGVAVRQIERVDVDTAYFREL